MPDKTGFMQKAPQSRQVSAPTGTFATHASAAGSNFSRTDAPLAGSNLSIQRLAKAGGESLEGMPGIFTQNAMRDSGSGEKLSPSVRLHMETAFGSNLGDVRMHTDTLAARAARELNAKAFTSGQEIYFGDGQGRPDSPAGVRLLAHELTHTIQQKQSDKISVQASRVVPADSASEKEADTAAYDIESGKRAPRIVQVVPSTQLSRDPLPIPSTLQIGAALDSSDPVVRGAMLRHLSEYDDEATWRALLLAQTSHYADVQTEVEALILSHFKNKPTFGRYLQSLTENPGGALSDLAVRALVNLGSGAKVKLENYSAVIYQRLDVARAYLREMDDQLYALINTMTGGTIARGAPPDFHVIDDLQGQAFTVPVENLWEVGLRASTLLDQIAPVRQAIKELQAAAPLAGEGSEVRRVIRNQLLHLLVSARNLTGEQDDAAALAVQNELSAFPAAFAKAIAKQLYTSFTKARDEIQEKFTIDRLAKESDIVKQNWQLVMHNVVEPTVTDLGLMISELELLQPEADGYPEAVMSRLDALQPMMSAIGERARYLQQAGAMLELYGHFKETNAWFGDDPVPLANKAWAFYVDFQNIAANRDRSPEKAQQDYEALMTGARYEELMKDTEEWQKTLEHMAKIDAFFSLVLDVFIIIVSIETGGLAGTLFKGAGAAVGLGRFATGAIAFGADVTAFTATSRGLRWAAYGEDFTKGFGTDLTKNALLFLLLKGSGGAYQRFGAPRLPAGLRAAGAMSATFTAFQAWSIGLHRYETGEWIGLTDKRFWSIAAQNVLFLGAIHLGSNIVKPLFAPIKSPILRFTVNQHNQRSAALESELRELDPKNSKRAVQLVRQIQRLYVERLDVLRAIHENDPNDLPVEEFRQAEQVMLLQVQAAENVLFQSRFEMTKHETLDDTFYYNGHPEDFRKQYESQGFQILELDPNTGRMRVLTPEGEIVNLIRTRLEPSGAREAEPGVLAAEAQYDRIRESKTDVVAIARNTGIPEHVIQRIKEHVFIKRHKIPFGPGDVRRARFTPDSEMGRLWTSATLGKMSDADFLAFRRLMAHEFAELSLMARGHPYHSLSDAAWQTDAPGDYTYVPTAQHFGAHDLAPLVAPERAPFAHWQTIFGFHPTMEKARELGVPIEDWMGIKFDDAAPEAKRPTGKEAERAAMEESQNVWSTQTTETEFARHKQTFKSIAQTLRNTAQTLAQNGQQNLLPTVNDSVLRLPIDEFIRRNPGLNNQWQQMQGEARYNPELRRMMRDFIDGRLQAGGREIGNRETDIVEFFLDRGEVIVTDITTDSNRVHQFKTEFYRVVLETMMPNGPRVYGLDLNVANVPNTSMVTP